MKKIQDETIQQRMALDALAWERASLEQSLNDIQQETLANQNRTGRDENAGLRNLNRRMANQNYVLSGTETAARQLELQQLDSAARATVERRMTCFQDGRKLTQDCQKWIAERPRFFDRYWQFADASRILSRAEKRSGTCSSKKTSIG